MRNTYNAFDISPVPIPGADAIAPEPFHGLYGMPMFVTVPTTDLSSSLAFWTEALGFFELFAIPGQLVHLRRWAFQDVLLVPAAEAQRETPALSVSFACVLSELDGIAEACERTRPGSSEGPIDRPWNSRELVILTPEGSRVVYTAAKPFDPESAEARNLAEIGITPS